jgi:hypothetical protein
VKFHEIDEYQQVNLIEELIHSRTFNPDDKEYRPMSCEGSIERNILPNDIIDVIYNKDIEKLKNSIANKRYN